MYFLAYAIIFLALFIGWKMVQMQAISGQTPNSHDPIVTDPPLLQKHSALRSFDTLKINYQDIRVFFRPHEQIDKLPTNPSPLPLLVFIHGLGGSAAQFHPLLITLVHVASCLAIDLPGCGRSKHATNDWAAYTPENILRLLEVVIDQYRDAAAGQKVVLIGHSMGTALAARLANKHITLPDLRSPISEHVVGLVAICPSSGPYSPKQVSQFKNLLRVPETLFDLWRAWDRRGGGESQSVKRFVGPDADPESKRLQDRFNNQSRTPVWRRMAWGLLDGIPGEESWTGMDIPIFLVAGSKDNVTPPEAIDKIERWIKQPSTPQDQPHGSSEGATTIPKRHKLANARIEDIVDNDFLRPKNESVPDETPITPSDNGDGALPPQPTAPDRAIVKQVLEGTHALLYMAPTTRVLAGLISDFLSSKVSGRLDQAWQLRYLSQEAKWDVKNLEKWQKVVPVSGPIGGGNCEGVFRAMKTLRQKDATHTPEVFANTYGRTIRDVVDISHQTPVYDPAGLEAGGIRYHKFPTVSKIPPPEEEVALFIELIDRIRAEQKERAQEEGWDNEGEKEGNNGSGSDAKGRVGCYAIGVHCHYGFNRTGYFLVCYLVDRCGFTIQDAIAHFADARPHGIKHQHFLDKLYLRNATMGKAKGKENGKGKEKEKSISE